MSKLKEIIGEEAFKALPEETRNKYKDTDFVNSADYVPKDRFNQVNTEKNDYKQQLADRDKQLNDLQGKVKDNEALTKEIENLKNANSKAAAEYEEKLKQLQYDVAINNALKDSKAKDINLIKALLDKNKLKVNGEEVIGLKEQLEAIKKEKDYLFEKEVPGTGHFDTGGKGNQNPADFNIASELGKQKAEAMKVKNLADFAK